MRLYEAFIAEPSDDSPSLVAIAPETATQQRTVLRGIVPLNISDSMLVPIKHNKPALILSTQGINVLLGYIDAGEKMKHKKVTVFDGEMYLTAGSTRGIRMSESGDIDIVNMYVKDDGEIITTTVATYSADNSLEFSFENLKLDMFGASAGGNVVWTQDGNTGINTYITNFKTSSQDVGPRIYHRIEGTPKGASVKFICDVTPSPVGGALPTLMSGALPLSLQVEVNSSTPLKLSLKALAAPLFTTELTPSGALKLTHNISKSEISMEASGEVTVKSTGGLSKITMSPTGAININTTAPFNVDAKAGFELKGKGIPLLDTIGKLMTYIQTHTHPTGTGPSGPPIVPPSPVTTLFKTMKG